MDIKSALTRIVSQLDLTTEEMRAVMLDIMTGQCSEAQIGAFMMGMRMKSETIDEIVGAVTAMRELASKVELKTLDKVVDIVGTGGDGANIFNVSTASALVVAAAGCTVAKHGNRAVSGKSGSADLLEAAGVYLNLDARQVARCIDSVGIGFMFAQAHHSAMKHAAIPRRDLGLRTLFNMLGPLTNPAGVRHQVVGVFTQALCRPLLGRIQPGGAYLRRRTQGWPGHRVLGRARRPGHQEPKLAWPGRRQPGGLARTDSRRTRPAQDRTG
jgi:anthranilate phosphoribosyltransferase